MIKTCFKTQLPVCYVVVVAILGVTLSACGGGGSSAPVVGGSPEVLVYPDCPLGSGGSDDLAGCWISEQCLYSPYPPYPRVRYLSVISQTTTIPNVAGKVQDYFIQYDSGDCTDPVAVIDMAEYWATYGRNESGVPLTNITSYEVVSNETCYALGDPNMTPIPCQGLDATIQYDEGDVSETSQSISSYAFIDARLCVPLQDYVLDVSTKPYIVGILFNGGWELYRDTTVYTAPGRCLTRFTPH